MTGRRKSRASRVVALAITLIGLSLPAAAQVRGGGASGVITPGAPATGYRREAGVPASDVPAPLREVGFDQNLDRTAPLDVPFSDEQGRTVRLGDYFGSRPVVLALVYYGCPMLCTQVLNSLAGTLRALSLEPARDFEVVTVSFDPRETPALAAAKKAAALERYPRAGAAAGWHFLTGTPASIDRLTRAVGFRYVWDRTLGQFAHPAGLVVLTPEGRTARYLFGLEYGPRDLRLAIVDASAGKVGTPIDQVLLYCYHYDPAAGRYGLVVMSLIRLAGAATVVALAAFIVMMIRHEKHASTVS